MKITNMIVRTVSVPFKEPIKWGWQIREESTSVIVEIISDEGIKGFGESPSASIEIIENIIKPQIMGENIFDIEKIKRKALLAYICNPRMYTGSWSAVELAIWDIIGKKNDIPIYNLIGGHYRNKIPISHSLHIKDPEEMAKEALKFTKIGIKSFSIKLGMNEKLDIQQIKEVRKAVGDDINLRIGVNSIWTYLTALKILKSVEKYNIECVYDPLRIGDMDGIRKLSEKSPIPIVVHDDCMIKEDAYRYVKNDGCDALFLDVNKAGGIIEAKKLAAICEVANKPLMVCMGELGVIVGATINIVASTPNIFSFVESKYLYLEDDIIKEGGIKIEDGCFIVGNKPGLGVEIDENKLEKYKEYHEINVKGKIPKSPLKEGEIVTYSRY